MQKECYPIFKSGKTSTTATISSEFIFPHIKRIQIQLDFYILNALMSSNDVIFIMKIVSDLSKDQRNMLQCVLLFSLISHIELNEQQYDGKKA